MDFISKRKLKYYTKEAIKFFNITLIAFGFIIAIVLIKYKPMYEVKLSGEEVGYIENKKALSELITNNVENYQSKNIEKVELSATPEYELKLVEKTKESDESDIIIALQKELDITYKYYEIASNDEVIEKVDTLEEMSTDTFEVAKENIIEKLDIDTTEAISNINGIKIATLPVSGTISSRYGAASSIRSSRHTGLDIAASVGTPIKVVADGIITYAAYSGSYGYLVKVDHGNGVETWYAHTSKMYVKPGQEVKAGDVIAAVGNTGNSTGPHLHLEIRINGQHVNPQKYIY